MAFQNDYTVMLDVLNNKRPQRLPIYEHIISPEVMEKILGYQFADMFTGDEKDVMEFSRHYCRFFEEMTYDVVSFEITITEVLPDHGAIYGGRPGPIQNRSDYDRFPWEHVEKLYWDFADERFNAIAECLPEGMKALGGVGNGAFEISEDLVGFEYLAYMQVDDPELFTDIYVKIGDLMVRIWSAFLERYANAFAVCRFGDDLGFRTSTLVSPLVIRKHILPQYKRVLGLMRKHKKPFLWHSCGNIFSIMGDVIDLGINGKHSNEDAIAPFDKWIELFGDRIGLLGGIDVDILCQKTPEEIVQDVVEKGTRYRNSTQGYALGSGNSIPEYVPVDGYLAMIEGAKIIRSNEEMR
jgi:uroporphyrinogen decarboxylase